MKNSFWLSLAKRLSLQIEKGCNSTSVSSTKEAFSISRYFSIFLLAIIFSIKANSATKTWTGATNSDWNTGSNWGGTVPAAGDIANIPGGLANYPIIDNTVDITTVNINSSGSGASITVVTGGIFTVTGLLTVNATGSFIQTGGTLKPGGITTNNVVTFSGGTIRSTGTITINNGGVLTQSGGVIHMAVNQSTDPTDNLVIATGGTLTQSDGTLYIKDYAAGGGAFNQTGSNALFKIFHDWKPGTGSTFNSTAGTVQFTGSGGGGPDFAAGTRQFTNIIVDAGVIPVFDNVVSSTIPISGNFTNNNTTLNVGSNATFNFNGTGAQTISSASTGTNASFGSLTINNSGGTVSLASNINVTSNVSLINGSLDLLTYSLNRSAAGGTFSISAGLMLRVAGSFPANFTTVTLATTSTVEYYGTAAQTIAAYDYGNLTTLGSRTSNSITYASGTVGVSNVFNPSATFTSGGRIVTGNTFNFNGSISQTIPAFGYNNLTSTSTGARTLASSGTVGVAGTFTPGSNTYTITGSTIDFNGSGSQNIPAFDFNNLTSSSTGARTLASSGTIGISGSFTPGANTYTITGSTVDFKSSGSQTIPAMNFNNLTSSSTGARTLASSGTIGIAGNFTAGTNSYTVTGSTVDFNGPGAQNIGGITFNNLTTSNAGTKSSTGNIVVNGTFTVNSPTTFSPGAAYTVSGSGTLTGNGAIKVTRVTGTPDLANQYSISTVSIATLAVDYNGAGNQTVNALNYGDLTVSTNGTRTVTLANSGTIGITGIFSPTATTTTYVVTGSTVDFNGSGAQTIAAFTFNNLSTSNAGTKSISGNIVVNGTFTVGSGTIFSPAAANVISGSGTLTGSGTLQVTRTAATPDLLSQYTITNKTLTGLTVDYNSTGSQTVNALNYGNLTVTGARTSNSITYASSGTIGISGVFNPAATFTTGGRIITGSTIDFNGSSSQTIPAFTYYNLTSSSSGSRTLASSGTISIAAAFTKGSNSYTTTGSTIDFNGTIAQSVPQFSYNNLTVSGAHTTNSITFASGVTTYIAGAFSPTATFTTGNYIVTNTTIDFNGSVSQTIPAFDFYHLTSSSSGARVLASSGTIGIAGTFTPGSNSFTITGSTINYNGADGQSILAFNYNNLSSTNNNRVLASSGTIGIAGTFTPGSGTYTITGSTVDFNGSVAQTIPAFNFNNLTSSNTGARTLASSGTVGVAANFTGGSNTYTVTGSTVNYNGSSSQTIAAITYNNLTVSNGGTKTFSSSTATVGGILTVSSGPTLSITGGTLNVTGTFTPCADINAGGTLLQSGGTLSFIGGTTNVSGIFNQSSGTLFSTFNLNISSGGVMNQSGTGLIHLATNIGTNPTDHLIIAGGGTVNQSGGTLEVKDYVNSPGTFNQNGSSALLKIFHDWKPGAGSVFNSTSGTVQFYGTAGGGPDFAAGTRQFNNIIVDADPAFDNVAASTVPFSGDFTNNLTTLNLSSAVTFTINGTVDQTIYSAATGTNATFGNLVIDKTAGNVLLSSNCYVAGNTSITNGTLDIRTYIFNRKSGGGTFTISNGAKLILAGNTGGQTGSNFPLNYTTVTLGATSTVEYNGSNAVTQTVYGTTYGHLTLTNGTGSGSSAKISTASITANGTLTVGAGTIFTPAAANTIGGTGTLTGNGTIQVTRTAATADLLNQYTISNRTLSALTVDYNATAAQTVNALNYFNLTVSGRRTTTSVTLANSGTIGISGVFTPSATFSSGNYITTSSTVDFNGSSAQNIPLFTFNNLTVSAGGVKTATGVVTVIGAFTLSSTVLTTTSSNLLVLNDNATTSGASLTAYVNGPIKKIGNDAFTFPVGKTGTGYMSIAISAPSVVTDAFTAEYMRSSGTALGSITASGLYRVSNCDYWNLNRTTGSSTVDVTLSWNGYSNCNAAAYINNLSAITVVHFNGTNWDTHGRNSSTGSATSGTVTRTGVSIFSPFALGTTDDYSNPLQVQFTSIKAYRNGNAINVDWTNLNETGIGHYEIERSTNGTDFIYLGRSEARNTNLSTNYTWIDGSATQGMYYYRIKATDNSGVYFYSSIVKVNSVESANNLLLFPSPVKNGELFVRCALLSKDVYTVKIFSMIGELIYSSTYAHTGGMFSQKIKLPVEVKTGVYNLRVENKQLLILSKQFIVQH